MKCYEIFELEIASETGNSMKFGPAKTAVFEQGDQKIEVSGFYDGEGKVKFRFLPREVGKYRYRINGDVAVEGCEYCEASDSHGMVVAEGCHFRYDNGEKYYPFGTTIYALIHQEDWLIDQTLETLKESGFNKIRTCIFPKSYLYNHNEPPYFPFEKDEKGNWDIDHPCPEFWRRFESIIRRLDKMGIEVDLILFHPYDRWGFSKLSMEENLKYLDLVISRFSAFPNIWWSLANEYDLLEARTIDDWHKMDEYIAQKDPYGHLLSNHQIFHPYDFERPAVSHCCIQSSWVQNVSNLMREYHKPVIYDEMRYEGNIEQGWGSISAFEMVHRFWCVCAQGGYGTHGETYYSNDEILWWSKGGKLYGQSPERIKWLKKLLYELPGPLEPTDTDLLDIKAPRLTPTEKSLIEIDGKQYKGHCGQDAFLYYYGRQCSREATIELPMEKKYKVEVLDIWCMERKTIFERVNGRVAVPLLSKEGIAVLATVSC